MQSMAHSTKEGSKFKKQFDKSSCESGGDHGDKIIELMDVDSKLYHIPIHSSVCCQEFDVFELECFIKKIILYRNLLKQTMDPWLLLTRNLPHK